MDYKFKYAAGLPGYGINGKDGSIGFSGFSIYLTDYPESGSRDNIETRIKTNNSLLSTDVSVAIPGYPVRKYQNNDMFIDSAGYVFILENIGTALDQYRASNISLGSGDFLDAITYTNVGNDYTRYANAFQTPTLDRKLIDIVFGDDKSYYNLPDGKVFGIAPRDYGQIFHSSEVVGAYNPYYLFNNGSAEPKNAMALVRDNVTNQFRLGNLDDAGNIRDTNLNFDIHFLTQSKGYPQQQSLILTHFDMDASCLFNQEFDKIPTALAFYQDGSTTTTTWDSTQILNVLDATSINANLVVYPIHVSGGYALSYEKESGSLQDIASGLKYRTNIISKINSSGNIIIKGIDENVQYAAYIEYDKNGWVRRTNSRVATTPFKFIKFSQSPIGYPTPLSDFAHTINITISSNTSWAVQSVPYWMSVSPSSGGDGTPVTIQVAVQDDYAPAHNGDIVFVGGGITRVLKVYQAASSVQLDPNYDSNWIKMTPGVAAKNDSSFTLYIRKIGKVCVIQGRFKAGANMSSDKIVAQVLYESIYEYGKPVLGSSREVTLTLGSQIGNNAENYGQYGYIPTIAESDSLYLYLKLDSDGFGGAFGNYYSINATFFLD